VKKRKSARRRRLSPSSMAMLLVMLGALAGSALFMLTISGSEMTSRAHEVSRLIEETGATLAEHEPQLIPEAPRARTAEHPHPSAQQEPAAQETAVQEKTSVTLTLAAAGTVYAPKAVREGTRTETGEYDFSPVFAGLDDALQKADLSIVTLETLAAGDEKDDGNYNAPASLLSALRERGVNVVSLGTERVLDEGYAGLDVTKAELTARGMTHAGAHSGAVMLSAGGIQAAVLSYTYGLSDEGKAAASVQDQAQIPLLDMARVTQDIRQARADGASLVIVLPHWGTKNKQEIPQELREMAVEMAKAGADVILGTHPNVVQETERLTVTRADGLEYETVVCYSLGSLLTDARTEENTAGMIARLPITYDSRTRRISLGALACLPVYNARTREEGRYVWRVVDVENEQALEALEESERAAAQAAAERVREVTGQSDMEEAGQG